MNTTEPDVGLRMNLERMSMKCYMADTGLLVSHAFDENELAAASIHRQLIFDRLEINEGMMVENVVAQKIRCRASAKHLSRSADKKLARGV